MESRQFPIGAEPLADGFHFRVWAPGHERVSVQVEGRGPIPLRHEGAGYHAGQVSDLQAGVRYRLKLDDGDLVPDPGSRFQPDGPHGSSQLVDPRGFAWTDGEWAGRPFEEYVVYEMHIGTFTRAGTWLAAAAELAELASIGITCVEIMPVAEFPGRWGWGYDGVNLFAPQHLYGTPDDFRTFVDTAHRLGLCVVLDVVYNHFGPDGNYLRQFSADYFSTTRNTDWGDAINFDGPNSGPVREFFLTNAVYWIKEFHLDGLRIDATQDIHDGTPTDRHILTEMGRQVRAAAPHRKVVLIAENEPQHSELCRAADRGGYGLDALWNDDFHHAAMVALTGRNDAYYTDYRGDPQEFVSAAKYGYLYQGQWYSWQKGRRGRPGFDLAPSMFVTFIQNHDQIANSGRGQRAHQLGSPGRYRALMAWMLLGPGTPMLFQGQEFAASSPFLYFADHAPELAKLVDAGRREFLSQFRSLSDPEAQDMLADPGDPETFQRCKLDFAERESHAALYQFTKDLLALRQTEPCFRSVTRRAIDGAVLGAQAFLLRYFMRDGLDRLLVVNLGRDLHLNTAPEPLLGSLPDAPWKIVLSTDEPAYGGGGVGPVETEDAGWRIPGEAAVFLKIVPNETSR
ncbi:MAG TPA: malto-oligosyltrehalose trehalohydrolase [Planctomycetaceae bacterium]|nr:malto-oligosyltrehalose trehalohydrolase [Planctomycetaceae bacterium]